MICILSDSNVASAILRRGNLVAFPTDTVYGLGGNAYSDLAVSKIFQCKQRPSFNPISVCYADINSAKNDVEITPLAKKIASKFMPGAITLILERKKNSKVSWLCSAGTNTLGIRIPNNQTAISLLKKLNFPLAAPSANMSQGISATNAKDVASGFDFDINLTILDGGDCPVGIESTIIDLTQEQPIITRIGAISADELKQKIGVNFVIKTNNLTKHYTPSKEIIINALTAGKRDAFLGFGYIEFKGCKYSLNLSPTGDINEAAKNFFSMIHQLDASKAKNICIAPIPNIGIGEAINLKLLQMVMN